MADSKITALTALTAADPANDMIPIVDVSDTPPASGNTKRISINNILACSPSATLASATISGDLTVRTNKLAVTSTGVGIGTATPNSPSHFYGSGRVMQFQPAASTANTFLAFSSDNFVSNRSLVGIDGSAASIWAVGGSAYSLNIGTIDSNSICFGAANAEQYRIAPSGVFSWYDGAGGTRMTLNSTGLGIGDAPTTSTRLTVAAANRLADTTGQAYIRTTDSYAQDLGAQLTLGGLYNASANYAFGGIAGRKENGTINNVAGYLDFLTTTSAGALTSRMRIDSAGNLLLGKTASSTTVVGSQIQPDGTFSAVKGDTNPAFFYNRSTAASGTIALFRSNSVTVGSITQDGTNTAYVTSSDYRLKESVAPLVGGLARVSALKPSIYKWKSNGSTGEGFLAHELAEVVPAAVTGEKDAVNEDGTVNPQGVDLSKVVPILVAAIQELTARVQTLEAK
jgi:hypothetical protein